MKSRSFVAATSLLALLSCAPGEDDPAEVLALARIEMDQAVVAALDKVEKGVPFEVELEKSGDQAVFKVDVVDGEKMQTVVVDAATGAVKTTEAVADTSPAEKAVMKRLRDEKEPAKVLQRTLLDAAKKVQGGKPVEVDVDLVKDKLMYTIQMVANGKAERVEIEAAKE